MTNEMETLKAIREKEIASQKRIEKARSRGEEIVKNAAEEAKRIIAEAEAISKRAYDDHVRKELEAASLETLQIKKRFGEQAGKLRKEISGEIVEKIANIVMENND